MARVGCAALAFSLGCVEPDVGYDGYSESGYLGPGREVAALTIDAGRSVDVDPGAGVGVAIEYAGDGLWELTTSCDTATSGAACSFDILASADESDSGVLDVSGVELEARDLVLEPDAFAVQLQFSTSTDLDGVQLVTDPGAPVRISALLYAPVRHSSYDWSDDPRILSWVGHGALHWGAPTNPVDLIPDQP